MEIEHATAAVKRCGLVENMSGYQWVFVLVGAWSCLALS